MDEFNTDIFTFRRSDAGIVDDVVLSAGFRDDDLLDSLDDVQIQELAPYVFGYQHIAFH